MPDVPWTRLTKAWSAAGSGAAELYKSTEESLRKYVSWGMAIGYSILWNENNSNQVG